MQRFLQSFMLRMFLNDGVSESFCIDVLNYIGYDFGKNSNYTFGGRKICCAMHTCVYACVSLTTGLLCFDTVRCDARLPY